MPFSPAEIMTTGFRTDVFQEKYFIVRSVDELYASLDEVSLFTDKLVKRKRGNISLAFA